MNAQEKWFWKMRYCATKRIPPAQSWAWEQAEQALQEYLINENRSNENVNIKDSN